MTNIVFYRMAHCHVSHQLCPFGQVSPMAAAFLIFYVIITVSWSIWMNLTAAELVFFCWGEGARQNI